MARPLRIEVAGGFYHVVAHGNGRLWLFRNDNDRMRFLKLLGDCVVKYNVIIHSFVLMTTHFHLLVETPVPSLSDFMRKFLSDYGQYYNRRYRRRGSVFKSRYGSFLIQKENYYLMVIKYLYENPLKAGVVTDPFKYKWSSLYYLLQHETSEKMKWYNATHMLQMVGGKQGLIELMASGPVEIPLHYRIFIGDKKWADGIIRKNYDRLTDETSHERDMRKGVVDPDRIMKLTAQTFKISKKALVTGRHKEARNLCLYLLSRHTPLEAREIGDIFGMSKWAVFKAVQRIEQRKIKGRELKKLEDKMSNVQL
jgi:REP element-mobilizing transposase RayT